jgi:hypothetical protein
VAAAASRLPFPPVQGADIEQDWNRSGRGVYQGLELRVRSNIAAGVSRGCLLGGEPTALVFAPVAVDTVDFANDELEIAAHSFRTGDGPARLTTTGTIPSGLATGTDYWIAYVDDGAVQLAASRADAFEGIVVAIADAGTGVLSIESQASSERMIYCDHGLLGQAADGGFFVDADPGYMQRLGHSPRAEVYAVRAIVPAGVTLSIDVSPIVEL